MSDVIDRMDLILFVNVHDNIQPGQATKLALIIQPISNYRTHLPRSDQRKPPESLNLLICITEPEPYQAKKLKLEL